MRRSYMCLIRDLPIVCAFALTVSLQDAAAQDYPSKPILLLVTTDAGGTGDFVARALAERLSKSMGQPVVIENQPSANGGLAAAQVGRAKPDGHTLLLTNGSTVTINPHLYKSLPFNPANLRPVGTIAEMSMVLTVSSDAKANSLTDLIAEAKRAPGKMNYASTGVGTQLHIGMELFKLRTATDIVHIPYRGNTGAMSDLMGGRVDMILISQPAAQAQLSGGRVKILAIAAPHRSTALPDVPTFAEAGVKDADVGSWYGLMAPVNTPQPIVDRLSRELKTAGGDAQFNAAISKAGMSVVADSPAEMETLMKAEEKKWTEVLDATGTRIDQ